MLKFGRLRSLSRGAMPKAQSLFGSGSQLNACFKQGVQRFSSGIDNTTLSPDASSASGEAERKAQIVKLLDGWPGKYRLGINKVMRHVLDDEHFEQEAKSRYIDSRNWQQYASSYRRRMMKEPLEAVRNNEKNLIEFCRLLEPINDLWKQTPIGVGATDSKDMNEAVEKCKDLLFPVMMEDAESELSSAISEYYTLCSTSDLRIPHEWYPQTRLFKRKIIYHGGPTNSGKTYQALQRLRHADAEKGGGLYCGPLRLLALEVYESLNKQGIYTDLVTGQEKRQVPFSTHISSTLEMVNLNRVYDVAVIDEIQMIADRQRGYAWTRALQGIQAKEIHVCGGLEAMEVVKKLAESQGDDFELHEYDRLGKLEISESSLQGDYSQIQPGDCIVAFSRADIFSIRRQVERLTPYKCSIIYGQLPPETRSMQARLFNEESNDILVASDAIGMGLNLNIRRIVFHTTIKRGPGGFEGDGSCYFIDPSNVKQIAGRAGRLSSKYKVGHVTAWQEADLAYIKAVMSYDVPQIESAGIFPSVDQIELFSDQLRKQTESSQLLLESGINDDIDGDINDTTNVRSNDIVSKEKTNMEIVQSQSREPKVQTAGIYDVRLSSILERFVDLSQIDGRYFLCEHSDMVLVSNWLHSIPLSLADRFIFANCPVNTRDSLTMTILYQFAATYAQKRPVAINVRLARHSPRDVRDLADLCTKHNTLDLYIWLSYRFPKYFVERDICLEQKAHAVQLIQRSLDSSLLQEKYSHSHSYKEMRKKLNDQTLDGLPPLRLGSVRNTTRENLSKVDQMKMELYPRLAEETAAGLNAPSSNKYGSRAGGRSADGGGKKRYNR